MAEDKNTIKRLNIIIALLSELIDLLSKKHGTKTSEKFKMARLKRLGLENQEIGLLFNKTTNQVSKQIYEIKRKRKSNLTPRRRRK